MQFEIERMDRDARMMEKQLASIYDKTLSDKLLCISTYDLKRKLHECQRESGYHMPLDIVQCFTTGCRPKHSCLEHSENRMLLHVGYVVSRLNGCQRGDWLNAGIRFADAMDSSADVMELMDEQFPMWFVKLPVMSMLTFYTYVCAAQQFVRRSVQGDAAQVNSFIRRADEHDLWKEVRDAVRSFLDERVQQQCSGVCKAAEDEQARCLEESMALLEEVNRMLPLSTALNDATRRRVKEAWRVECHDLDGSNKLKRFERREWQWLLFETRRERWIHALRRLSAARCDDVHTTVTSVQLCDAIARQRPRGGLEWHGFRDGDAVLLRPVRLQSDVMRIWEALLGRGGGRAWTAAGTGAGARSKATLVAEAAPVAEQVAVVAALFGDGGGRFIEGARAVWQCAPATVGCACAFCAGRRLSPAS